MSIYRIGLIILLLLTIGSFSYTYAQTAGELRDKISISNGEIFKLEAEIAEANKTLTKLGTQKDTLSNEIAKLDLTAKTLAKQLSLTEKKVAASDLLIKKLSGEIINKKDIISIQKDAISNSIQTIHNRDEEPIIIGLISTDNLSETWQDIDRIISVTTSLRDHIEELNKTKKELEGSRDLEEETRQELVSLKKDLVNQKNILAQNKKEKDKLLAQTKNQESEYQKLLADKTARKASFEKELANYESALKFILDPNSLPKNGSNVLSWPLDYILVTQYFGKTVDAQRLYVSGTHNGMDFRAPMGTRILASASGKVIGAGDTDLTCPGASYGKWVFIRHTNGLSTLYGHLSTIGVSEGQDVRTGQIIGYSGSTGYSTGPHLHFGVYASSGVSVQSLASKACNGKTYRMPIAATNAYLDPLLYLPKISTR